jgi:beta-lactamase regulating signal transducer with metallopeptidase domain/HEAT repeat protein
VSRDAIGWALVHALWQAAALAALLAVALAASRRAAPAVRYVLAVATLVATLVLPLATVAWYGPVVRDPVSQSALRAAEDRAADSPSAVSPGHRAATVSGAALRGGDDAAGLPDGVARLRTRIAAALPVAVQLWAVGLVLALVRLAGGVFTLQRLVRRDAPPASTRLQAITQRLARRMRVPGLVAVRESARLQVPVVIGWLRPLILVPTALASGLSPAALEALVAHELAHIRRYDILVNLLQRAIETVFFFHPAVWWISARVREEREACCDDLAVRAVGGDVATYAAALLSLEELRDPRLATVLAASGGPLLRRVERLIDGRSGHVELGAAWASGLLGLLVGLLFTQGAIETKEPLPRAMALAVQPADPVPLPVPRPVARDEPPALEPGWHLVSEGPLMARWATAGRRAASRGGSFWLGYALPGPRSGGVRYHFDDSVTIRVDGDKARGRVVLRDEQLAAARIPGRPLAGVPPVADPTGVLIFAGFEPGRSGAAPRLTRIHVASAGLPASLGERPVYWLGIASDRESLALLRTQFGDAPRHLERDLVATVGIHEDGDGAAATLAAWLTDRQLREGVREEAARWLALHATPTALTALAAAARASDDRDVAREAIESLGRLALDAATDTLVHVARTPGPESLREDAIEALGERGPRAAPYLAVMASAPGDADVQAEAVAALARASTDSALGAVARILEEHDRARVRRKAARAMARAAHPAAAISVLDRALRTDPDGDVRLEAVKSMRRVRSVPLAVATLAELARAHESGAVRRTAVRSLGSLRRHELAEQALRELARADVDADVREHARAFLER